MAEFNKVGLLVQDESGRFLMCRKDHDTSLLILPGGRIEDGETDMECLNRELAEELGQVTARNVEWVGLYTAIAHNDDPNIRKTLEIRLYKGDLEGIPAACGEIQELFLVRGRRRPRAAHAYFHRPYSSGSSTTGNPVVVNHAH